MKHDRILEEVWKAKDELARRFNYDMHRMAEHFRSPEEPLPQSTRRKRLVRKRMARSRRVTLGS